MDFTGSPEKYHIGLDFGFAGLSDALVVDGQLRCRAFRDCSFFTRRILGDNYGLRGGELAVRVRHGQHLVAGIFDRAGLMRGNVAGVRGNNALMRAQDRGDHGAVDLRAAYEELYLTLRQSAALAQQGAGGFAVGVLSVAGGLLAVRFNQCPEHIGMRAFQIIAFKPFHHIPSSAKIVLCFLRFPAHTEYSR